MSYGWQKLGEASRAMQHDSAALCSQNVKEGASTLRRRTFDLASVECFLIPSERKTLDNITSVFKAGQAGNKRKLMRFCVTGANGRSCIWACGKLNLRHSWHF